MNSLQRFAYIVIIALSSLASLEASSLKRSDVVFMYFPEDATLYEQYQCTVQEWGSRPAEKSGPNFNWWNKKVLAARQRGIRYMSSIDGVVDFKGFINMFPDNFIEAATRDLEGKPIRVPWLMDHDYEGRKAWFWCTNNPNYISFLKDQVERACSADIDGLHMDDYRGTSAIAWWGGGGFCQHCMSGFRTYLKSIYSQAELQQQGVKDLQTFDYGEMLRSLGWTPERYKAEKWKTPLNQEFQRFQTQEMKKRIAWIFSYAEQLRGKPLMRSVNSSAGDWRALFPAQYVTNFCGEIPQGAETKIPSLEPLLAYRTVEALGRMQTATASGGDWAWVKANDKPGLVRCWIAQTYGCGSVMMAPTHQWCHTQKLGTHWWDSDPAEFSGLYRFVRQQAALLDGYQNLAKLGLIYSKQNYQQLKAAVLELAKANVPFAILVAGDEELPARISSEMLGRYSYLLKEEKTLPAGQQEIYEKARAKKIWLDALPRQLKSQVIVRGSGKVRAFLRHKPSDDSAPLVCHLVNQDYDLKADDVKPAKLKLMIGRGIWPKPVKRALLHQPGKESVVLSVVSEERGASVTISDLGIWGIVELQ
jgi:hypothetical protein